ncbi:MAG: hypothetical protein FD167_2576 [bacterium]|nr:MAG: hypothetical protein FD167_2576 [bacterium]
MLAPAGYFCTNCPTVIIDQAMISQQVSKKIQFNGVLAIDYNEDKEPDFFKTWNGKSAVYLLDESTNPVGLVTSVTPSNIHHQENKISKNKRKNRLARESRKRNRHR